MDVRQPASENQITWAVPYAAVVRKGSYEGLLERDFVQSLALRNLLTLDRLIKSIEVQS